ENDTASIADAYNENGSRNSGEKITLSELFKPSAGLELIVERSAWTIGEQSLEDKTAYFESLSKPQFDNALPLPKHARSQKENQQQNAPLPKRTQRREMVSSEEESEASSSAV
ncbi:hypothetical protein MMC29_002535, partial [Sticta canariensis]|nr:hypothetical protein [Sticta canariensis]